jgi:hypothetical protein
MFPSSKLALFRDAFASARSDFPGGKTVRGSGPLP